MSDVTPVIMLDAGLFKFNFIHICTTDGLYLFIYLLTYSMVQSPS